MSPSLDQVLFNHLSRKEIIDFNNNTAKDGYSKYIRLLKFDKRTGKLVADVNECQIKGGKMPYDSTSITLAIWGTDYHLGLAPDGELLSEKSREFLILK